MLVRSLSALSALLLCSLASCALPKVDVMGRYGPFDANGDIGISSGGASGSNDLDSLGVEDDDSVFGLRADLDIGSPHIVVSVQNTMHDGDGTLDADISQDGVTIPAGSAVETDFEMGLFSAYALFDVIPTDMFELAFGVGVTTFAVDAEFQQSGTPNEIDLDETLPIPVLGVNAAVELGPFEVAALLGGISLDVDGDEYTLYDVDTYARWAFFGGEERLRLALLGGYRRVDVDFEYEDDGDDVNLDAVFDGPYLGLELSF